MIGEKWPAAGACLRSSDAEAAPQELTDANAAVSVWCIRTLMHEQGRPLPRRVNGRLDEKGKDGVVFVILMEENDIYVFF